MQAICMLRIAVFLLLIKQESNSKTDSTIEYIIPEILLDFIIPVGLFRKDDRRSQSDFVCKLPGFLHLIVHSLPASNEPNNSRGWCVCLRLRTGFAETVR